ncbi:MAG: sugar phosphate nucleotidyltransferase [Roseibium album]|uniref:sugar phosphate nucleotidyltransferase n=1 Tax=Roseibium album TaxID=311410 RepID=UPI0032EE5466
MKVVLFCGGFGTRLREYSETIPKPLVPIGNRPILWNLMKYYAHQGHREFILCLGYRGDLIREYFLSYNDCLSTDFRLSGSKIELFGSGIEDWDITFVDTGMRSNIGERLVAVRKFIDDEVFLANYSDGLSDVDMDAIIETLRARDAVAAFVSVKPSNSLSKVESDSDGTVQNIEYLSDSIYINAGFFVFTPGIYDYIGNGEELVEEPFQKLIADGKLVTYKHEGFWRAMDTFKDKMAFDAMCEQDFRPWEIWR